ncbi:DUF6498-containing protein [Halovivax limisalsi]|uniref:DUF6498-containing protein n=1 Tax=Halovivax limisalsi TaxID=1453760 RepID=UPI001FFDD317|nr:DUF6498-containing protein [Halovivax limisalsi]
MARRFETSLRSTTLVIVLVNLCPLAGFVGLEWTFYEAMFVYWIDIGLIIAFYNVLLVFGQQPSRVADKAGRMHAGMIPFPKREGSLSIFDHFPPIRYRNLRLLPLNLVLTLGFWSLTSRLFLEYTNPAVSLPAQPEVRAVFSAVRMAYSPGGLSVAIVLFVVHAAVISREFFGGCQYERFSAAMLAEFSGRASAFWFVALIVGTFLTTIPRLTGNVLFTQATVFVVGVGGKAAVDVALLRIGRGQTDGCFTKWFVPYEPAPPDETEPTDAEPTDAT